MADNLEHAIGVIQYFSLFITCQIATNMYHVEDTGMS